MSSRASARLRKTFQYPDDEDDITRDDLDEEEQEKLIDTIQKEDASQNAQIILVFSILPLTVVLPFFLFVLSANANRSHRLLCVLSISSLLASGYTMRFVPLPKDNVKRSRKTNQRLGVRVPESDGPIEEYLPVLNGVLSGLLAVAGVMLRGRHDHVEGLASIFWVFLFVPAVMWVMVMVGRNSMGEVGEGVRELSGMKYDYKGA